MKFSQHGLNRTELLILAASFSVLAIVLLKPVYETYLLKGKFEEVVRATDRYKMAIELCAKFGECAKFGRLTGLQEGSWGLPDTSGSTYLERVSVADNGTITARARKIEGLAGETYVVTPHFTEKDVPITWTVTGTCKTRPGGAIC